MEKDILARMGFMTQSDKSDFEKRFEILVDKTEKLEQDVSTLNSGIARLEKKLDELLSGVVDSRTVINDVSAIVSETIAICRITNIKNKSVKLLPHETNVQTAEGGLFVRLCFFCNFSLRQRKVS